MSSSLYWRPPPADPEGQSLGQQLKYVFCNDRESGRAGKLWDHDGSLNTDWETLDRTWISFLDGVARASRGDTAEDARELISLIQQHGSVQIRIASD